MNAVQNRNDNLPVALHFVLSLQQQLRGQLELQLHGHSMGFLGGGVRNVGGDSANFLRRFGGAIDVVCCCVLVVVATFG